MAGREAFRSGGHDGVIAVGGGSGMDAAKAISLVGRNDRSLWDFDYDKAPPEGVSASDFPPFLCVPTTAGTGAETESTAMVTDTERGVKLCVWHPACDGLALEAIRLIYRWLPIAARDGANLEARGIEVLVAVSRPENARTYDFRPPKPDAKPPPQIKAKWRKTMKDKLRTKDAKAKYNRRKCTVEPVFDIIKNVLGFTRFSPRGLEKVKTEWILVTLAHNCKRLCNLKMA